MPTPRTFTTRTASALPADSGVNCSLGLDASQVPVISCWQDIETPGAKLVLLTDSTQLLSNNAVPLPPETIRVARGTGSALAIQKISTATIGGTAVVSKPWVAYYDLDLQAVNVAHRESGGWEIDLVEAPVANFAAAGLGIAIGSNGQPRISYCTGNGLTFATRIAVPAATTPLGDRRPKPVWQRDTLAGSHWECQAIDGQTLTTGFDMGQSAESAVVNFSPEDGAFKLDYQPSTPSANGAVFTSFGPVSPRGSRTGVDVSAYSSLIVEMRGSGSLMVGMKTNQQRDDGTETKVPLTLRPDFTTYTIPLTKFTGTDMSSVYFIAEFVFGGSAPVTAFVRSVKLSDVAVNDVVLNRAEPPEPAISRRDIVIGQGPVPEFNQPAVGPGAAFQGPDPATNSYRLSLPPGGFVVLHPSTPDVDLSAFQSLEIEMRGGTPLGTVRIGIRDRNQPANGTEFKVSVPLNADLRTYSFPLGIFQTAGVPNLSQLFVVAEFVNESAGTVPVFVRSVRYTAEPPRSSRAVSHCSLTLDASDTPYISYLDLDIRRLRVACRCPQQQMARNGTQTRIVRWALIDIPELPGDVFGGEYSSIKVDDQGTVHIAYWTLSGPRYTQVQGQTPLIVERIENAPGAGMFISLDVRANGDLREPEVAYYDAGDGTGIGRLKAARRSGGTWAPPEIVDPLSGTADVGGFASLAMSSAGKPVIAYYDFANRRLKIASVTAT